MKASFRRILTCITICATLATVPVGNAQAQEPRTNSNFDFNFHIGRDIAIVSVAVGVGVGLGIYFARRGRHVTGCATSAGSGLLLVSDGDRQTYALVGDTAAIKPGDRVRLSGKKQKRVAASPRPFMVKNVSRDFGACNLQPATP